MRGKAKSQPELVCLMSPEMAVPKNHPIRFSGKYEDVETGYNYYGYRFYNPECGRWLNRDSIEEFGGRNLYAAVLNCPQNYFDANGNNPLASAIGMFVRWLSLNGFAAFMGTFAPGEDRQAHYHAICPSGSSERLTMIDELRITLSISLRAITVLKSHFRMEQTEEILSGASMKDLRARHIRWQSCSLSGAI